MAKRKRTPPMGEGSVIDSTELVPYAAREAELVDDSNSLAPPPRKSPEEQLAEQMEFNARVRAKVRAVQELSPEERYDATSAMLQEIQLRMVTRIMEREQWLDDPRPEIRAEAVATIEQLGQQVVRLRQLDAQYYELLGLGERKGILPGGKEVPRIQLPSHTQESFEKEFQKLAESGKLGAA